ncbi:hypothetical protein D3C76_1052350 [compost metagenome]
MAPLSEPSLMERFVYGVTQNLLHGDLQLYYFSNRSPLSTTNKLTPPSANTANHMVAKPIKVITRNTALMPRANPMFCLRIYAVCRDRRTKGGILLRSSSINATSAVSMAVPVPEAAMAKPICDFASAGTAFIPSPTIPATWLRPCNSPMAASLSAGNKLPRGSSMPTRWAMA